MSPARPARGSTLLPALAGLKPGALVQSGQAFAASRARATGLATAGVLALGGLLLGSAQAQSEAQDTGVSMALGSTLSASSHSTHAALGSSPGLSPLSSLWQRHADRVGHFHLGQARFDLSLASFGLQQQSARLFGDYYLTGPGFGSGQVEGGLRLTSGLAFGRAAAGWSMPTPGGAVLGRDSAPNTHTVAQPYLGLGYSSLSLRAGWAFSADIGLGRWAAPLGPRLGQGGPSDSQVERLLDDLRLSPVIQLGVRYAF